MNSKTLLLELLQSHPVVTVYHANFSIEFQRESGIVIFRFIYVGDAPEYVGTIIEDDDGDESVVKKLVCFHRQHSLEDYLNMPDPILGHFYIDLFNKAHTQLKITEVGEA